MHLTYPDGSSKTSDVEPEGSSGPPVEDLGRAIYLALRMASPTAWMEGDFAEEGEDFVWDEVGVDGSFRFGEVAKHLFEILGSEGLERLRTRRP